METKGKIGVLDSGLGGLWMLKHLRTLMPEYDYVFFGDQAYVPYGNKTNEELLNRVKTICTYLFDVRECTIILLACNTTSTTIFQELREWVMKTYPGKYVWGMVRPTVEAIPLEESAIFFGTHRTVTSHVYKNEIEKRGDVSAREVELPELATLIERGEQTDQYIASFNTFQDTTKYVGVLVCTHYGIVREDFKKAFPEITTWIYQEDIIPRYIQGHFVSHSDLAKNLSKESTLEILISKENAIFENWKNKWFGETIDVTIISL